METLKYGTFTSIEDVKDRLSELLKYQVTDIGYIEPGHGLKGKQRTLIDNDDIDEMYDMYKRKRCYITLWCCTCVNGGTERPSKKRRSLVSKDKAPPPKRKDGIAEKLSEVELTVKQLKDKHGSKFSIEQFNAWAHMISVGKHCSLENPPNLPYFVGKAQSRRSRDDTSDPQHVPSSPADKPISSIGGSLSPGKRVSLRTECIDQLSKWHQLLEKGGIDKEQYDSLQKAIIGDIFKGFHAD